MRRCVGELLRPSAVRLAAQCAAERHVRADHHPLDVVHDRRIVLVALVEASRAVPRVPVRPGEQLQALLQVGLPMCRLVQLGRDEDLCGERLGRLELVSRVPPDAAAVAPRPTGNRDEPIGANRIGEKPPVVRRPVGVEERQRPPAVVVEEDVDVRPAFGPVPVAADRLELGVPVALGAAADQLHHRPAGGAGAGGGDDVRGLEEREYVPEGGHVARPVARLVRSLREPVCDRVPPGRFRPHDSLVRGPEVRVPAAGARRGRRHGEHHRGQSRCDGVEAPSAGHA